MTDPILTLEDIRAHRASLNYPHYEVSCLRRFFAEYGIDWRTFAKEGVRLSEFMEKTAGRHAGWNQFLDWYRAEHGV
jgi:hypothetical protein